MKKRLLSVAFLMGAMAANAQVGIGTATPNKSAELLIQSSNRGLLIPNVALTSNTDKTTITNGNVESLLVYATATTPKKDITPGYYYWDGAKWARLTADKDIPQIVVNEFANILKMDGDKVANLIIDLVKNNETLTVLAYNPATGVLTYTDEKKQATTIDVKAAVKSFETVTSITTDATKGTITFKDEAGKDTVLDMKSLVKANETLTVLGYDKTKNTLTYSDEKGAVKSIELGTGAMSYNKDTNTITYVDAKGVPTTLTLNKTSLTYNETKQQLVYVDSEGKTQTVDLSKLVKANETLTVLGYDKASNTLTYTDEKNAKHTLVLGTGAMSYNKDTNTITYTDAKGVPTTLTLNKTSLTYNETKQQLVYVDSEGKTQTVDLSKLVKTNETVTTLVREKAGKYVYTSENNTITDITVIGDITEVIKNKVDQDLYNVLKNLVNVEQTLTKLVYNATSRELVYTDEQNITHNIDVDALVKANETLTVLAYEATTGALTYKDEKGATVTVDVKGAVKSFETVTSVSSDTTAGTVTFVDEKGVSTVLNLKDLVKANETLTVLAYNPTTGALTYNDEKGATVTVDVKGAVKSFETVTSITTDAAKGTITFKDEAGKDTVLDMKSLVKANETLTVLGYDQATNTLKYKDENGVTNDVVLGTSAMSYDKDTNTITYVDAKGISTTLTLNKTSLTYNEGDQKLVYVDSEGKTQTVDLSKLVSTNISNELKLEGNSLTSTVNGKSSTVVLTDANVVSSKGISGTGITVVGGGNSTLKDVTLSVTPGTAGQVMVTTPDGKGTTWVNQGDIVKNNTTNEFSSTGNSMTSNVNGVSKSTDIVNSIGNSLDKDNKLVTTVNGKAGEGVDLTPAIQAGQLKTTVSAKDEKVTVVSAIAADGKTTNYVVGVDEAKLDLGKMGGEVTNTQIANGAVTTEKIKAGNDGEVLVTVIGTDGKPVTKWVTQKDVVKANETVTKIVDHGNGTFTYTDEKGTPITFDGNKTTVEVKDGIYTFKDGNKNIITTINTNAIATGYDNGKSGLTSKDVQGAIDELVSKISAVAGTKGTLSSTDITVTEGKDALLKDVTLEIANGAITTDKIKNGAVTPEKMLPGKDGEVLVTVKDPVSGEVSTKWEATTNTLTKKSGTNGNTIISTVNGAPAEVALIDKVETKVDGTTIKTVVNGVESASVDLTGAIVAGQKTTSVKNGSEKITVVTTGAGTTGKNTEYTVDVVEAKLDLGEMGGQVKTSQIENGAVTPEKIKGGTEGQVMVTDKDGNVTWTTPEKVATTNTLETKGDKLVSTVNNVKSELTLAGDVVLKNGETVVGGIQGTPVSETKPAAGQTLVYNITTNTWEPGIPKVDVANVTSTKGITGTGITVGGGANSTLKDVTLAIEHGAANQVMVTNNKGDGTTWVDQATIALEPWNVQGGVNKATENTQNIYQQGKVAIGLTKDDITTKTLEVKGDFKTASEINGVYSGIETNVNDVNAKAIGNILYTSKSQVSSLSDLLTVNEVGGLFTTNNGFVAIAKKGEVKSTLSLSGVDEKSFDITLSGGFLKDGKQTSTNLWGTADQLLLGHTKENKSTKIDVQGGSGITFRYEVEGYTFPMNKGENNQVLVADGGKSDSAGKISKLSWKNGLDILNPGTNNQVLTTVDKGGIKTVEWKTPVVDAATISNGKALTSPEATILITGTDVTTALLKDTKIDVANGAITPVKIKAGDNNQVLTTVGSGKDAKVVWKTPEKPATVTGGKTETGDVVVTPVTDSTTGDKEYKLDVKSAMPKVFYMPPVVFDTSVKGVKTRNLHTEYLAQFKDVAINLNSTGKVSSIPNTTKAGDLDYYVTYHDSSVVKIVSVGADGLLTYEVIGDSTPATFMTIVFVVK